MVAMPDPSTFASSPGGPRSRASRACSATSSRPSARRTRATRATSCAARSSAPRASGFDLFDVGVEPEYFLFRDSKAAEPLDEGGYFDLTTLDAGSDVRRETVLALEQLGIARRPLATTRAARASTRSPSATATRCKIADDVMTCRITVKEYALKYGWHATFMPKPLVRRQRLRACTRT